ncbi:MAG: GNAT family N-acetyltransferase [Alkalibacterium sp.]|nr:GNAT family N-acetyltransferase [Alkalibacterium sp.]
MLEWIEKIAREQLYGSRLILDSQDHAIPFYEKEGFEVQGDGFLDAGIPHHFMKKNI